MIHNGPKFYLCIDANARTMNRYVRYPGHWGPLRINEAEIPETAVAQLGSPEMLPILARFRMTGKPE